MEWLDQLLRRSPQQIPDALWETCLARLPFLRRLSAAERARLKIMSEKMLDTKTFTGAGGFELTDEIAVLIAAQASLPVLNLTLNLYADLHDIVIYPAEFIVPKSEIDEAGVVHEWREPVAGEAVDAGGAVVLSWADVESGEDQEASHNVVIHEFVHKIDMEQGSANGRPRFLADFHGELKAPEWQLAFSTAYTDFTSRVDALETQIETIDLDGGSTDDHYDALAARLPLAPYAATHPAEFLAVASEAFFVAPAPLADAYPEIYRLLSLYYRQNPLQAA